MRPLTVLLVAAGLLAGCTTARETLPGRSATEQLLISTAADRAVARLDVNIEPGTRVFLDTSHFDGYDQGYAIGALRDRLLREGLRLVAAREEAEVVIEPRAGALSVNKSKMLFGLPAIEVPVPLAGQLSLPEIALFAKDEQRGVAKLAMSGYDTGKGDIVATTDPVYGFSNRTRWVLLVLIGWISDDLIPEEAAAPEAPEARETEPDS